MQKYEKVAKEFFKILYLYLLNFKKPLLMKEPLLVLLIVSSNCWEQNRKELSPKLGETIDLSSEGEKYDDTVISEIYFDGIDHH